MVTAQGRVKGGAVGEKKRQAREDKQRKQQEDKQKKQEAKKQTKRKADEAVDEEGPSTSQEGASSGVVFIGHVPHGFYEEQLRGYFSQFGTVTKVRLSRNKKTGKSKNYAYLEFQNAEVAQIAAKAMDGYLLLKQKLVCRTLKPQEVHEKLWVGANRKFKVIPRQKLEAERHNRPRSAEEEAARLERYIKRDAKRQKQIAAAGMEYNYESLEKLVPAKAQKTLFED